MIVDYGPKECENGQAAEQMRYRPDYQSPAAEHDYKPQGCPAAGDLFVCKHLKTAQAWARTVLTFPRAWGQTLGNKFLGVTKEKNPKALRAHDALVLTDSGAISFCANLSGPTYQDEVLRRPFARTSGDVTTLVRGLTATTVRKDDVTKLTALAVRVVADIEKVWTYWALVINLHLLVHLVEQIQRHGPLWETMMWMFESSFGVNKLIKKNPARMVASMASHITRRMMMTALLGMMDVVARETAPGRIEPSPFHISEWADLAVPPKTVVLLGKGTPVAICEDTEELRALRESASG